MVTTRSGMDTSSNPNEAIVSAPHPQSSPHSPPSPPEATSSAPTDSMVKMFMDMMLWQERMKAKYVGWDVEREATQYQAKAAREIARLMAQAEQDALQ